jgi:hypothetical protein
MGRGAWDKAGAAQPFRLSLARIALFADRQCDGQAIPLRGKRAGGVRGVGTGRVLQAIEIKHDAAGMVEAMVREIGIEEAACAITRGSAGGIAHDEEELLFAGTFKDGLKLNGFAVDCEFGEAWGGHFDGGTEYGWNFFLMRGDPYQCRP